MKIKRLLAPILVATLFLSACGGQNDTGNGYAGIDDVEFWSTYSTEKVIRDNTDIYDGIKGAAAITLTAIRGEEEAAQIIMTTGDKPVKEYDLSVSDLKDSEGNVFPKDNVKVYHELYIEVGAASEYYTEAGFYPDALAPFEGVKAAGENSIASNSNQGLYISFDVPYAQPAGEYTGSISVTIEGGTKNIPINLEVSPAQIGAETHVASSFLNEWYFYRGELDTTEEMFDKYNKFLFDYRLGCNNVTVYKEDVEYYAEKVCEYAAIEECPGYNIPWFSKNYLDSGYSLNGRILNSAYSYDADKLQEYLYTIAEKGLETGVDPFEKAFIYGWDEPDLSFGTQKAAEYVKEWAYIVRQCKNIVIEKLEKLQVESGKQALKEKMTASLDEVPHLVLSNNFLNVEFDLEQEDIVYGPYFSKLGSEGSREQYRLSEDNDLWWYGCTAPRSPYPTYHIDDTVLSARLESWMKAEYDIQGNLYWSTCLYTAPEAGTEVIYPEDFYSGNAARTLGVYGEGFLLYPGKKYGVDGPISSVRLEQIRDGLEEYEMIYSIKQIYREISQSTGEEFDEVEFMSYLYSRLYSGARVSTTSETFGDMRRVLIDLTALAQSEARVCITSVSEGAGQYSFEIFVRTGYELLAGGEPVTSKRAVSGGSIYTVTVSSETDNILDISVNVGDTVLGLDMVFGSGAEAYDAEYIYSEDMIQARSIDVETELVDAASVMQDADVDKFVKIKLAEADTAIHDFLITGDVMENIGEEDDRLVIRLYNPGESVAVEVMTRNGSDKSYVSRYTGTLESGMNSLAINNLYGFNWQNIGYLENVRIRIGAQGDPAISVYIADITLYKR